MTALLGVLLNRGIYVCIFDSFNRHIIHIILYYTRDHVMPIPYYGRYGCYISGTAFQGLHVFYHSWYILRMILTDGGGGEIS